MPLREHYSRLPEILRTTIFVGPGCPATCKRILIYTWFSSLNSYFFLMAILPLSSDINLVVQKFTTIQDWINFLYLYNLYKRNREGKCKTVTP